MDTVEKELIKYKRDGGDSSFKKQSGDNKISGQRRSVLG